MIKSARIGRLRDFDIGLNVGNARTCADTNGHNIRKTEIVQYLFRWRLIVFSVQCLICLIPSCHLN